MEGAKKGNGWFLKAGRDLDEKTENKDPKKKTIRAIGTKKGGTEGRKRGR